MSAADDLSRLARYEALFELSGKINTATELAEVGQLMARRLKYIADVFSWRYLHFEGEIIGHSGHEGNAMVIDGHHGEATITNRPLAQLSDVEVKLLAEPKSSFLTGQMLAAAQRSLPEHFQKDDIVQLFVHPHFGAGELQGLFIFSRRRQLLTELDVKFVVLAAQFFHEKAYLLWEQRKLYHLEQAYLQQEIAMRQNEKLASLGKLSAGMAHELNNPAAAAVRGTEQLRAVISRMQQAHYDLGDLKLSEAQLDAFAQLEQMAQQQAKQPADLAPLIRSDREYEMEVWLEDRGLREVLDYVPILVNVGYDPNDLARLAENFTNQQFSTVIVSLSCAYAIHNLLEEIGQGAGRIAELVKSLKSYTYLDQAPIQTINLHEGLDNTLVMLGSKLRNGVAVQRAYDTNLPHIQAFGSELNQVWTNIIDNAVAAMGGQGELVVRTYQEEPWVVVEISDTGPGIPAEIQAKIFDPFFTTKAPGEGTGLGLNISHNIITQKHKGRIAVSSTPGMTRFEIRLPINFDAVVKRPV